MAALEFISITEVNGMKTFILSSPDFKMTNEIRVNTLVDEGEFENVNNRSGHFFLLNDNELRIKKQGEEEDQYPEISYIFGGVNLTYFFEEDDYDKLIAHLLVNTIAPIAGGRRRRRTTRRRFKRAL